MLLIVPVAVLKLPRACAQAVAVAAADVVEVLEEPVLEDELLPQPASRNSARGRNTQPTSIFPGEILPHIRGTFIEHDPFSHHLFVCQEPQTRTGTRRCPYRYAQALFPGSTCRL